MAANHDVLGYDGIGFLINYFKEPAALGAVVNWESPTDLPMYRSHPWNSPKDAVIPADILSRPPITTGIETVAYAARQFGAHGRHRQDHGAVVDGVGDARA